MGLHKDSRVAFIGSKLYRLGLGIHYLNLPNPIFL